MALSYAWASQTGIINFPANATASLPFNNSFAEHPTLITISEAAGTIHLVPGVYLVSYKLSGTEDSLAPPQTIDVFTQLRYDGAFVPGSEAYQNILPIGPGVTWSAVSGTVFITVTAADADPTLSLINRSAAAPTVVGIPNTQIRFFNMVIEKIR